MNKLESKNNNKLYKRCSIADLCILQFDLILHEVAQKNPANYPLQIFRTLPPFRRVIPQITRCWFSAFGILPLPFTVTCGWFCRM